MGGDQLLGPEEAGRFTGIRKVLILCLGREAVFVGSFRPVAAGVGVSYEFNDPVRRGIGLEEFPVRDELVQGGAALEALGPLLQDYLMGSPGTLFPKQFLQLLLGEQADGGVLAGGADYLARGLAHGRVYPYVVVVLVGIGQFDTELGALETHFHIDSGPVEGDGAVRSLRTANDGYPAVRGGDGFGMGLHAGRQ